MRTALSYLRRIAPWIAFGVLSTAAGWQWGALAGLVVSIVLLAREHRLGVAAEALVLDVSTVVYFALLSTVSMIDPDSPVKAFIGALPFGWLTLTAWSTIIVHRPFTLGIAKLRVPEPLSSSSVFVRFNTVISTAWAISFTFTAIASTVCVVEGASVLLMTAFQMLGVAGPGIFTYVKSRRTRNSLVAPPPHEPLGSHLR